MNKNKERKNHVEKEKIQDTLCVCQQEMIIIIIIVLKSGIFQLKIILILTTNNY